MLYEVITIIGAGNVGRGLAATLAGAGHDVLLTNSNPSGEALAAIAATTGATAVPLERALDTQVVVLARITSYNVCYTKLLRHVCGSAVTRLICVWVPPAALPASI